MKRLSLMLALIAPLTPNAAQAETFKCVSAQGQVTFAFGPCPDASLGTPVARSMPPKMLSDGEPVDHAHQTNLKATEYLKVSGRTKVIVTETERYKQFQRNRPPAPAGPSQCRSPVYDSRCFDPSGGRSRR